MVSHSKVFYFHSYKFQVSGVAESVAVTFLATSRRYVRFYGRQAAVVHSGVG